MASVGAHSHGGESKDGSWHGHPAKSFRNLFPRKRSGGTECADGDRAEAATRRGGDDAPSRRDPPDAPVAEEAAISTFNDKGNACFGRGEYDAALRLYGEALRLLRGRARIRGAGPGAGYLGDALRRCLTARCLVNVGAVHLRRADYAGAAAALELATRQAARVAPGSGHYRRGCEAFADGAEHLGLVRCKQRRYDGADGMYARALQARRTCLRLIDEGRGAGPSREDAGGLREERRAALLELSVTLFHTALLREKQDRIAEAVACCEEALRTRREVVPDARDDPDSLHLFAAVARLYCHKTVARHRDALGYFHEVHRLKCEASGRESLAVVPSLNSIAGLYHRLGDFRKCLVLSDRAIDIATSGRGLNRETCVAYVHKGGAHRSLEEYDEALSSYETARATGDQCYAEDDVRRAEVHEELAATYQLVHDQARAVAAWEAAVAVKRRALGPDHEGLARAFGRLGECHGRGGQLADGVRCHTRALRIFKHIRRTDEPAGFAQEIAVEHNRIATLLKATGDPDKAMEHYVAALWHSREAKLPSTDPVVADTIKNVAAFQKGE